MLVRGQYSIPFFTRITLLLGFWTHALGDSSCKQQHEQAGKTVVLSPGPINETLIKADWLFNTIKVTDMNADISGHQFTSRLSVKNYNLTIRDLRTTDSGDFRFASGGLTGQRKTICIRLSIQEVLTKSPTLTLINITEITNESCMVSMKCSFEYDKEVNYSWTVNNVTTNGPTLQYQRIPHDGDTTVTCAVSNMVSEKTGSTRVNCGSKPPGDISLGILIIVGVVCAVLILTVVLVIVCRYKKTKAAEVNDELTVYAEIDDTCSKIMKPCSVYETVGNTAPAVKPTVKQKAQTIYDQIEFSRMQQPQNI